MTTGATRDAEPVVSRRDGGEPAQKRKRTARWEAVETSARREMTTGATWDAEEALPREPARKRKRTARLEAAKTSARREAAETSARREAAETSARRLGSPVAWFHPDRYNEDLWTQVAKHLSGRDLMMLSLVSRWFFQIIADDSIWRYAFFRELLRDDSNGDYIYFRHLHVPPAETSLHQYWRFLYIITFHGPHTILGSDEQCGWVGGFLVDAPELVVTARLPLPKSLVMEASGLRQEIEQMGTYRITNARCGVWAVDMKVTSCTVCGIADCEGIEQVLEARHCDFLLDNTNNDELSYEEVARYVVDKESPSIFSGIFNRLHIGSTSTGGVLNVRSWIGDRESMESSAQISPFSAALNTNLPPNRGTTSIFETLEDLSEKEIVCIRVSQIKII